MGMRYRVIFSPGDRQCSITAYTVKEDGLHAFELRLGDLTEDERKIILDGCLINFNRVK